MTLFYRILQTISELPNSCTNAIGYTGRYHYKQDNKKIDEVHTQPQLDDSGRVVVVYNGLIQNRQEIEVELKSRGYKLIPPKNRFWTNS